LIALTTIRVDAPIFHIQEGGELVSQTFEMSLHLKNNFC